MTDIIQKSREKREEEALDYPCSCAGWQCTAGRLPGSNRWNRAAYKDNNTIWDSHIAFCIPSRNDTRHTGESANFLSRYSLGAPWLPNLRLQPCDWPGWSDAEEHYKHLP